MKAAFIAPFLLLASCGSGGAPDIQISDAWARETVAGQSGTAAYATIANRGTGGDRLIGVTAAAPVTASLHATSTNDGIASMRALDGLQIPAGGRATLKPGAAHVMISGLTKPLRQGDVLKLTLRFKRSGDRPVDFKVAQATGGMDH